MGTLGYIIIGAISVLIGYIVMAILRLFIPFKFLRLLIAMGVVAAAIWYYATKFTI